MRTFSAQDKYYINIKEINLEFINSKILDFIELIKSKFQELNIERVNELSLAELEIIKSDLTDTLIFSENYNAIKALIKGWANYGGVVKTFRKNNQVINIFGEDRKSLTTLIKSNASELNQLVSQIPNYSESDSPKKVYIPTLRGLRPLDEKHTDFYLNRTRKDYFIHQTSGEMKHLENVERKRPEVFTGLTLFQRITDLLLGNNFDRKLIAKYQEFISEKLFEGKSVALIPNQKEKVVIVKIGNEAEQPIYNLGDGIQSAIILSFLPFVIQ